MSTQLQPSERWKNLKASYPTPSQVKDVESVTDEIAAIDKATPWQEVEPQWWLEMKEYSRNLQEISSQRAKQI